MHIWRLLSFLWVKMIGTLYRLKLGWIQPFLRQLSSCLHTSACSVGKKWHYLGFGGLVVSLTRSLLCATLSTSGKTGSKKILEYSYSKSMTSSLLETGETGGPAPWSPCPGSSLAIVASRYLEGCKRANQAGQHSLHTVLKNYLVKNSSTYTVLEEKST